MDRRASHHQVQTPKNRQSYLNRGFAWFRKHEYDKAIADYNEVIRLDPHDALTCSLRSLAWSQNLLSYDRNIPPRRARPSSSLTSPDPTR